MSRIKVSSDVRTTIPAGQLLHGENAAGHN